VCNASCRPIAYNILQCKLQSNSRLYNSCVSSTTVARWILYEYNRWLVSATAEERVVSENRRNVLHSYFMNTPQVARQNDWAQKMLIFWQIWSLDPTRPERPLNYRYINFATQPDQTDLRVNPTRVQLWTYNMGLSRNVQRLWLDFSITRLLWC